MAVFLHFGKEISDMMVKHISIEVTSKQTKKPVFGGPADLTAYILEPVDGILDKKRPAVLLCPGGGYRTLSTREDQPIAMKYLAAGFHVLCFITVCAGCVSSGFDGAGSCYEGDTGAWG